jgi:Outer membrane lipoprotein carrier protein LolA-like
VRDEADTVKGLSGISIAMRSEQRGARVSALLLLWSGVLGAATSDAMDAVRQRLADAPLIRGQFQQTRRLAGFQHPLISSGEFVLVRGRGALWRTGQPFASTLVVTADALETRDAQGQVTARLDAHDEPALRAINDALLALLSGDPRPLAQHFSIETELLGDSGWVLRLMPDDPLLARQLQRVSLSGERFVNEVHLTEGGEDGTDITFSGQSADGALTPEEQVLLGSRAP